MINVSSDMGMISECLVVCLPRSDFLLMSPVCARTLSCRQFISDDLPTPDGPATQVSLPRSASFNSSIPFRSLAQVTYILLPQSLYIETARSSCALTRRILLRRRKPVWSAGYIRTAAQGSSLHVPQAVREQTNSWLSLRVS